MCDYSLHGVLSRPAKVEDKLVSTSFPGTFTRGFADASNVKAGAVCLLPGTQLAIDDPLIANRVSLFGGLFQLITGMPRILKGGTATFKQVDTDRPDTHHDALEFPDGSVVLVTALKEGQHVRVLQLPIKDGTVAQKPVKGELQTPAATSREGSLMRAP